MAEPPGTNALDAGMRALRYRDRSAHELREWLVSREFQAAECDDALETLERTGLLDDRRFAESRARALADRGSGDALIRHDLESAGVAPESIEEALTALETEDVRARAVVRRRGAGPKTARYLGAKGFSHDVVAAAVATSSDGELG